MEPRHPRWHDKQLQNLPLIPQVLLRLAMGDRYYGFIHPDTNNPIGTNGPSGLTFTQSTFTGHPVLERAARMVDLSPLEESTQPLDQDVLGSWGQAKRPLLTFSLHNDDQTMNRMVGEEYTLNQDVFMFAGFPNLDWDYSQLRYTGKISRVILKKNQVLIEAETMC